MSDNPEATALTRRYKDAYSECHSIVGFGSAVKGIAFAIGGIIAFLTLFAIAETRSVLVGIGGFIVAAVVVGIVYELGVLICAQGQMLLTSLDVAVNTSPFLNNSQRVDIMGLSGVVSSEFSMVTGDSAATPDAPYRCGVCSATFATRPSVFYHIKGVHRVADIDANIIKKEAAGD